MTPASNVERFAGEHFTLNSISESRRGQVLTALAKLEAFLPGELEQATDQDLRAWLVSLLDRGLAPSTVGWSLSMVTPFYQWCWEARLIDAEALMRIRSVRPPRGHNNGVPRPYSSKELARFWAELEVRYPYATPLRIKRYRNGTLTFRTVRRHAMRLQINAIVELALVCGLRRGEIFALSLDDVHWDNKYIVAHGKRSDQNPKVREVPYADSTRHAIREWVRFRGIIGATSDRLWLSITGPNPLVPLSDDRKDDILLGGWTLHRLRHTCATERLRAGMELEKLQRFLGHANITQTLKYAQLVRGDIHKASERIDADFQRAIHPQAA